MFTRRPVVKPSAKPEENQSSQVDALAPLRDDANLMQTLAATASIDARLQSLQQLLAEGRSSSPLHNDEAFSMVRSSICALTTLVTSGKAPSSTNDPLAARDALVGAAAQMTQQKRGGGRGER
jgi:hypothetical protein